VNADLACGSCARRLSEMRGTCLMCGQDPDGVRRDVERRVVASSTARCPSRVDAHLRQVRTQSGRAGARRVRHRPPSSPARSARTGCAKEEALISAAVGDSAVSSTAPALLGELERLPRPWRGVFCARIGTRLRAVAHFSPLLRVEL
jgi:hypothetical protein